MPADTLPTPTSADEFADMLLDPKTSPTILSSRESLREFADSYARAQQTPGSDIDRQVEALVQKQLAEFYRDKGIPEDSRPNLSPQATRRAEMLPSFGQGATYNPNAPGAQIDGDFTSAVDYLATIWHMDHRGIDPADRAAKIARLRNAASSVSAPDGGFLVPESLRSQLLQVALEQSVVRPRATVVPMETARVPFPTIDVISHASSLFGGMIAYWGEESGALTDAAPKFGRVVLDAHKLTGLSVVPNELLADSILSFSALIERLWPRTLAFEEDAAFLTGSGAGEPLGVLSPANNARISVPAEAGQTAGTVVWENVVNMYARMLPSSLRNAVWVIAPNVLPQLFTMSLSVGTGGSSIFVMSGAQAAPMTLLGQPIIVSEKVPALGETGDISFVDFSYYLIGDRQMMTAASSLDWKFGNDQTAYRIIQRVDGRPWIQSPITPRNGGPSLSPFVSLAAR